ncbi:MAG TPA: hypothetical protein VH092_03875, partial [Urbifossiella sp.]|nr:hypothetical protein [Urbifossiella sp.]
MPANSLIRRLMLGRLAPRKSAPIRTRRDAARPLGLVERLEARDVPAIIPLQTADVPVAATANTENAAAIAMRPDGQEFVVAYVSSVNGNDILAQRYDANWQAVGSPIAV